LSRSALLTSIGVAAVASTAIIVPSASATAPAARHHRAAFAPAATASVHPGVQTFTKGAQCTSNFVYSDGVSVFLGQAAHCSGTGAATSTNGCSATTLPEGTAVTVTGARRPGVMVYNSWVRMQRNHESDANTCAYNDLALIRLDPSDVARTNPSVPFFGGPSGLSTGALAAGDTVASYGNSELRSGITALSPEYGRILTTDSGGWNHTVYTVTPGIPGDSGSGFLDGSGKAFGVLSTVALAPFALSNGVGDLAREIGYATKHGMPKLNLVPGTQSFAGAL
jgi:hypothetical protein